MGTLTGDLTCPTLPANGDKVDFWVRALSIWDVAGPLQEKGGVRMEVIRGPEGAGYGSKGETVEPLALRRTDAYMCNGE